MLHGLLYHSAVFICSACPSFPSAWSFYVRNPRDSLLADQGSTSLRSHGTHGRLKDKETVNAGQKSCAVKQSHELVPLLFKLLYDLLWLGSSLPWHPALFLGSCSCSLLLISSTVTHNLAFNSFLKVQSRGCFPKYSNKEQGVLTWGTKCALECIILNF